MEFKKRSNLPELMDDPQLPESDLHLALKDLGTVNKYLGGNTITIDALKKLIKTHPKKKRWRVVDVGCSDGEVLREIAKAFKNTTGDIEFLGLDINSKSIKRAKEKSKGISNLSFNTQNILEIEESSLNCDVIICTLTMHHFTDDEILVFLEKFKKLAEIGIVVNDLERSKVAYRLFQIFSSIFMKSKVAKYDGKISIARSFKRQDLETYSKQLALTDYSIDWKWAFRYVWVIKNI